MIKPPIDADEMLKNMAAASVKQGENLRETVRDLTLKALQTRELSLGQIKQVVKTVTEGVNLGAGDAKINVEKALSNAFAGMDEALLKAVHASALALQQLTGAGQDFQDTTMKKALSDLEKLEDEWLKTVKEASGGASEKVKEQWGEVLKHAKLTGTDTGAQVSTTMEQFGQQMQAAMRQQREASLKAAHMLSQNFATLASGVLMGLSEAMQGTSSPAKPPKRTTSRKSTE